MPKPNFVHLHVHSHYSLLDGLGKVPELVGRAKELGMPALALTDHGVLYGAIEFFSECKKAGLKPIIGQEAYIAPHAMSDRTSGPGSRPFHMILLAKNLAGYKNLIKITSAAHLEGYYYKPRVDRDFLSRHSEGLIASSACLASETSRLILDKNFDELETTIQTYREMFGKDSYYLELQDHPSIPEQQVVNEHLKRVAEKLKFPLIVTNDTHYVNSDDHVSHDQLVCIQTGKLVSDSNRMIYTGDFSLKTPQEMAEAFTDVPQALENTLKIADLVNLDIPLEQNLLPKFPVPKGQTEASYLKHLCEEGLTKRFREVTPEIRSRLDYELGIVNKMGYPGYFLAVWDFAKFAREKGIYYGCRGSAAGSLISYVIEITNIDPLRYDLLFERFLDLNRISMPDIDMDFEDSRRGEIIDYARAKYGDGHVAGIITFGTIMARAAVRDVGRVLGVPYNQVDAIAKVVPAPIQGRHTPLAKSVGEAPELKQMYDNDPQAKMVLDSAMKLEGTIRHASQHACAVVISNDPLEDYAPVQQAQGGDVHQVTQYSMGPIEKIGLLKMDFLGLANYTILRQCCEIIEAVYGDKIDVYNLPENDKETFELFGKGETTGVFQLECLSGDTIISNTTIKKLYTTQDKKRLESVYLDEGKVHKNKILRVLKGPKKQLYNLIATNGWFIKASADHHFLTKDGWKKLSELIDGEEILLKNKAKHLIYNTCHICGRQIDGQKEGKSQYCYTCSARHYSNPSKAISRQRIAESRHRFYESGGKPWNLGETKESSALLALTGEKISRSLAGKTNIDKFGPERAEEIRLRMSEAMRGEKNHMFGRRPPHRKGGFRQDLGHYVRSNWEADFARVLIHNGLAYDYEPETFPVTLPDGRSTNYTPDFFVPSENTYYEIKGWLHDGDRLKMEEFQKQYPAIKLVIISTTKFAEFALKYRTLVAWECPRIPSGFDYVTVKAIKPAGIEETYDIKMETPGNNYVANGFVVHNSSGMKRYIKELRPNKLEDIVAMVALYRPGPMQWIQSFIDRKNGKEKIEYLHPLAKDALKDTYGIPVYQEQVMRMSKDMCGFTGAEADTMRKAVGKKIPKLMAQMKEKFITGAVKNGVVETKARDIWKQLEDFAAYCFNKSHAVSYATIAYQTAYLKAHFPDCFMAALMTSDLDNTDRLSIEISECEHMGLKVLPPDVDESFAAFAVLKEKKAIRFGLGAIKNVGTAVAKAMVRERKTNGPYETLEDFLSRNGATLNKKVLDSLVRSGALDRFGKRSDLHGALELLVKYAAGGKGVTEGQLSIFAEAVNKQNLPAVVLPTTVEDKAAYLTWEKELLGLYLSDHPLKQFPALTSLATPIATLSIEQAGKMVRVAGILQQFKKITTKAGAQMAFAELEDLTGQLEVIVFPTILGQFPTLWQTDKMVIVDARISDKDSTVKLLAERVWDLKEVSPQMLPKLESTVRAARPNGGSSPAKPNGPSTYMIDLPSGAARSLVPKLKSLLEGYPGTTPVELRVAQNGLVKAVRTTLTVEKCADLDEEIAQLFLDNV